MAWHHENISSVIAQQQQAAAAWHQNGVSAIIISVSMKGG